MEGIVGRRHRYEIAVVQRLAVTRLDLLQPCNKIACILERNALRSLALQQAAHLVELTDFLAGIFPDHRTLVGALHDETLSLKLVQRPANDVAPHAEALGQVAFHQALARTQASENDVEPECVGYLICHSRPAEFSLWHRLARFARRWSTRL